MKEKYLVIISIAFILVNTDNRILYAGDTSMFFKGYSYMQHGEYGRAIEEFRKAIETESKHVPSYSNLALCYERMGRFGEAIEVWEGYVGLLPMKEKEVRLHISLLDDLQKVMEEIEQGAREKGLGDRIKRLSSEAVGLLEKISEDTYPNSVIRNEVLRLLYGYYIGGDQKVWKPKGFRYIEDSTGVGGDLKVSVTESVGLTEEPSHAIDEAEEGKIEPVSGDDIGGILLGLAKHYYEEIRLLPPMLSCESKNGGRNDSQFTNYEAYEKVIKYLKEVIKLSRGMRRQADAQFLLIQSYGKQGNWTMRDDVFINYLKTKSRYYDKDLVLNMAKDIGDNHFKVSRYDNAVSFYSLILEKFPKSKEADESRIMMSRCYEKLGTFSQALSEYTKLLIGVDKEEEAKIREEMAGLYERQGNLRLALENYEYVAGLYRDLKLYDKSVSVCERIIQKSGNTGYGKEAWYLAALNYIDKGEDQEAIGTLKNIVKRYPRDELGERAQFLTGYQYLVMGDKMKAKEEYEIFNRQYPESPYIKDAKRLIERFSDKEKKLTEGRMNLRPGGRATATSLMRQSWGRFLNNDNPFKDTLATFMRQIIAGLINQTPTGSYALAGEEDKPNVILITIDTLRADHLSCYGYNRETSPNIDRIAKEGVLFKNAISPSSWTTPTHMSILTGLYPTAHGVIDTNHKMAEDRLTIAERLKEHSYKTAAFISAPGMMPYELGYGQGFDTYDDYTVTLDIEHDLFGLNPEKLGQNGRHMSPLTDRMAGEWLRRNIEQSEIRLGRKERFFIFVHYWDVHGDYSPPEEYLKLFDTDYKGSFKGIQQDIDNIKPGIKDEDLRHMLALYDGEIRFVDEYIGRLWDRLKELDLLENTIVIITADHGEEFLEHNSHWHGHTLYDELIHVPLIIYYPPLMDGQTPSPHPAPLPQGERVDHRQSPSGRGRVIETQVSTIDIVPTVLELVEGQSPTLRGQSLTLHGRSLVPVIEGQAHSTTSQGNSPNSGDLKVSVTSSSVNWDSPQYREVYSETSIQEGYRSIRTGRFKMIYRVKDEEKELYDLRGDPEELIEVSKTRQDEIKVLSRSLIDWFDKTKEYVTGHSKGKWTEPDEEKKKRLKSLGYLQ